LTCFFFVEGVADEHLCGQLSYEATQDDLRAAFEAHGEVELGFDIMG
jgi:hypothetical protein